MTLPVPALTVPAFALTWWLGAYLIGRDPLRPALWRAAGALTAYGIGVASWSLAPDAEATAVLLCLPALLWAGVVAALLPQEAPERRPVALGWLASVPVFLILTVALPGAGRLVALAPLVGGLVLLMRHRHGVRPAALPAALTGATVLHALTLAAFLTPVDLGPAGLVVATLGLGHLLLGFLVAVADAATANERLLPDLRRAAVTAVAALLLCAGPAALTMLAAPGRPMVTVLQFLLVAVVMSAVGATAPIREALDRLAFLSADSLRRERSALLLAAEALPRRGDRRRMLDLDEPELRRLTRRALRDYGDLGRLLRNPLVDLPVVDRRLQVRGSGLAGQPLLRVAELRAVLSEEVARLRPEGTPATTGEWRHYNALYYCGVRGLRPYDRFFDGTDLARDDRRVLDWFRRYVPRPVLRRWQAEGATLIAARLWLDLATADPVWRRTGRRRDPVR